MEREREGGREGSVRGRGEEEGKGTGGEGDPLPTSRGRGPKASWEFCDPGRSRLPSQASRNCVSPSRFMNHRVPAHRRYQPTECEHAANCATHAVSLGGLRAEEGGWGRSLFALGEIVFPFHGNVPVLKSSSMALGRACGISREGHLGKLEALSVPLFYFKNLQWLPSILYSIQAR